MHIQCHPREQTRKWLYMYMYINLYTASDSNMFDLILSTISSITEMKTAFTGSPEQSSLSMTKSLKLFITQMSVEMALENP